MDKEREAIWRIAKVITSSTVENKGEFFFDRYKNFRTKYPMLYISLCKNDFDMDRLKYMLGVLEEVGSNERTMDDATKMIGQQLFDEYVDPVVKEQEAQGKLTRIN